jgi:hypothetical protein
MDFSKQMNTVEGLQMQLIGLHFLAFVAMWVVMDAMRRGMKPSTSYWWGVGVLFALIIFLPLYFVFRPRVAGDATNGANNHSGAAVPCRYCQGLNPPSAVYCAHCQKQLKGVDDIISNPKP